MTLSMEALLMFLLGMALLFFAARLLLVPMRWLWRLVFNAFLGALLLLLFNAFGYMVGYPLSINPLNALIAGFLGVPGVAVIWVVTYLL